MNKFLIFISILLITGLVGSSSAFAIQLPWQNNPSKAIPPTPAIMNVTTSNSTISSDTWNEVLNFIGLRGIDIFGSNNSKTVYFNVTIADENGTNLGTGAKVFKNETNHLWYFRTLHNGTNIAIISNDTGITISGTGSGESTTGSNIGSTGEGVFSALAGFDLQFKKLLAGAGISLSSNSTNITITNTATSSGYTKINNLDGGDAKVLATNSSLQVTVKTLTAGSGVTITNGSKTITISVAPGTDTNTAQIVSAGGTSIFKQRDNATQNTLYGLDSTRGIEFFTTSNTVDINTDFKVNSKTCAVGEHLFSFTNSTTGIGFTCTTDSTSTAITKANNLDGGDAKIFATNSTTQVTAKTLTAGTGITITNGSKTLTISSTSSGGISELNSINGGSARLLKSNSTTEGVFKSLTAGRGVSIDNGTNTITIDAPLKVANQTALRDRFVTGINNVTGIITTNTFSVNNSTCTGNQFIKQINNSTGFTVCATPATSGGSGFTNINNMAGGNAKILATNASNVANFKSLTAARGITITNGSTTITIDAPLKVANQTVSKDFQIVGINNSTGIITRNQFSVNTQDCSSNFVKSIDNVTGNVVCAAAGAGSTAWAKSAVRKTADYTATTSDGTIIVDSYGGNRTITLPLASGSSGQLINIFRNDTGASRNWVMVKTTSPDSLDNSNNWNLTQNKQALKVQSNGTKWFGLNKDESNNGNFPIIPTKGTGYNRWWQPQHISNTALTTLLAQTAAIQAYPFVLTSTTTFDRGEIDVSALLAGSTCRIGIYTSDHRGYPFKLISGTDIGTISTAATGRQGSTFTTPITLDAGLYYTAVQCSSAATLTLRANPVAAQADILGFGSGTAPAISAGFTLTRAYAAFPTNFGTPTGYLGAVSQHAVFLRATG